MELHQIRYFLAVAQTGNFTRAAAKCHVTQPSLSQQIINLEEEFGQTLFHRMGRRAELSEAGRLFLDYATRIGLEVENARKALQDDPKQLRGRVALGAIPTLGPYILPSFLDRCQSLHPDLRIESYEDFRSHLTAEVLEGRLDLALVSDLGVDDDHLHVEPFFEEPLLLVHGPGHRLAALPEIRPADLDGETFILLGEKSSLTQQVQRFCGGHNLQPKFRHQCAQVETAKALVASGLGVAILPQVVRHFGDRRRIVYRSLAGPSVPMRQINIIWHRQRYLSRQARAVMRLLREMVHAPLAPEPGSEQPAAAR